MRKLIVLTIGIIALASCSDNSHNEDSNPEGEDYMIELSFSCKEEGTRVFFPHADPCEQWERKLTRIRVFLFDRYGTLIHNLDVKESSIKHYHQIPVSKTTAGREVTVVAIGNYTSAQSNPSGMTAMLSYDRGVEPITAYNNTMDVVMSDTPTYNGFMMSAIGVVRASVERTIMRLDMQLERITSKVGICINVAEDFSERHGGATIEIGETTIRNITTTTKVLPQQGDFLQTSARCTLTQMPKKYSYGHCNLFYIYDKTYNNGDDDIPEFVITAVYDADGDSETTDDRTPYEWVFPLAPEDGNRIGRNQYYRYEVLIESVGSPADRSATAMIGEGVTVTRSEYPL